MRIPLLVTRELENQDREDDLNKGQSKSLIVAVVFVAVLLFSLFVYVSLRILRRSRPDPPKWFPTFMKTWWTKWLPETYTPTPTPEPTASSMSSRHSDRTAERDRDNNNNRDRHRNRERERQRRSGGNGVDRVTSVRSIMTLPEYRPIAEPDKERTIGREGERAGIDVVIEFPETSTEEEERREEHMAALYQIRLARQQEREAAAARGNGNTGSRRNRHESSTGRERGRGGSRPRDASGSTLAAALAAVQERDRRLSNVQYAEVGIARPDGSRVRASSTASDRDNLPLLGSGASMGHARNVSMESMEMFTSRPSMEARGSDTRGPRSMLDVDRNDSPPPPVYGGAPLELPPGYDQLHDLQEGENTYPNHIQVPLLRVESASPDSPLPTYPPQAR